MYLALALGSAEDENFDAGKRTLQETLGEKYQVGTFLAVRSSFCLLRFNMAFKPIVTTMCFHI